jgi:hypothetical protein
MERKLSDSKPNAASTHSGSRSKSSCQEPNTATRLGKSRYSEIAVISSRTARVAIRSAVQPRVMALPVEG